MKIGTGDGKGHPALATFLGALQLSRGGGAERGIEGDVVGFAVSRPRMDVAASLAVGAGA